MFFRLTATATRSKLQHRLTIVSLSSTPSLQFGTKSSSNHNRRRLKTPVSDSDPTVPPKTTLLFDRAPGIGRIVPLLTLTGSGFHTLYWVWYTCDLNPGLVKAGFEVNEMLGFTGLGVSVFMVAASRYFGMCLVHEVRAGKTQGALDVYTYSGWFNSVEKQAREFPRGVLKIVQKAGTDGGVPQNNIDDGEGVPRRLFGAHRTSSYVPISIAGKSDDMFGSNLLMDANNGQLHNVSRFPRYLENVLRGRSIYDGGGKQRQMKRGLNK